MCIFFVRIMIVWLVLLFKLKNSTIDFLNKFENSNIPLTCTFFRNKFYRTVTPPAAESHKGSSDVGGPDGPMTSLLLLCTGLIWGTEEV